MMDKNGISILILITFSLTVLGMTPVAQASGPFRGPCETLESARNSELTGFRKCLTTPQTSKGLGTPSTICKEEDDGFRKAQFKYDSCRKLYSLPPESEVELQN